MKDDGHILRGSDAVLARQQIALDHFNARPGTGARQGSTLAASLEGLAKQRKLRNPRSSKLSTSLDPIKPVAPVTRIRSSGPTMFVDITSSFHLMKKRLSVTTKRL